MVESISCCRKIWSGSPVLYMPWDPWGWSAGEVMGDRKSLVLALLIVEKTLAGVIAVASRG